MFYCCNKKDFHKKTYSVCVIERDNLHLRMQNLRRNRWVKILCLLCFVAQGIVLFPHHHHAGDVFPCFKWDCVGHEHDDHACDDDCCDHGGGLCDYRIVVIAESHRDLLPVPDFTDMGSAPAALFSLPSVERILQPYVSEVFSRRQSRNHFFRNICVEYIATAFPVRAGDIRRV